MKKIESVIINVVFALLLVIPLVLTLVSPKKTFSEWENRDLKSISEVSEKSVFSGEFGAEFEVWLTDHFFARDFWVKFKRSSDSALMIRESNGVAVGDNCLFDIPDKIVKKAVDKNISAIASGGISPFSTFCNSVQSLLLACAILASSAERRATISSTVSTSINCVYNCVIFGMAHARASTPSALHKADDTEPCSTSANISSSI